MSDGAADPLGTRTWMAYDDKAIYVAFECSEPDMGKVRAIETRPGANFENDDFVVLRLDPFDTRQEGRFNFFRVNALGTQEEFLVGGAAAKREWRGDWEAKAGRTDKAWIIEMRIPWTVISRPGGGKPINMMLNFVRMSQHLGTKLLWSNSTLASRPELEGSWQNIKPPAERFVVKPQLLAYGLAEQVSGRTLGRMGLDVKAKLSPQINAIGTLYPDVRNVEQQVESASFSRSERFLGDARPFFAEGTDYFSMGGQFTIGRLFYSRRIDDLVAGAKVFGSLDPTTNIGALATLGNNKEHDLAFTYRKDLRNQGSIRGYTTVHADGTRNEHLMGAAVNQRRGNWSVDAQTARLTTRNLTSNASNFGVDFSEPNLFMTANFLSVPQDFNPYLGLMNWRDQVGGYFFSNYYRETQNKPIKSVNIESYYNKLKHFNGDPFQDGWNGSISIETRNNQRYSLWGENRKYDNTADKNIGVSYNYQTNNRFRQWNAWYMNGRVSSSPYTQYGLGSSVRVLKKLDFGLSYLHEKFHGSSNQTILTAGWEFDPKRAITARAVRNGSDTNAYLAFRSSGFAGAEFFVILGDPNARKTQNRLVVKYVVPLK